VHVAERFTAEGFDVAIADVVTPRTAAVYRRHLRGCLLVHLAVTVAEARRRAATRRVWLTEQEFDLLHRVDTEDPPQADHHLDVTAATPAEQRAAVETLWAATASLGAPWNSPRHGPVTDQSRCHSLRSPVVGRSAPEGAIGLSRPPRDHSRAVTGAARVVPRRSR